MQILKNCFVFFVIFKVADFQDSAEYRNVTLYDILKPTDTHRFFDTLQFLVEQEYSDKRFAFDVSALHNFAEKTHSIEKMNKKYRDVLYDGDMALSYKQLEKLVRVSIGNRKPKKKYASYRYNRERRQAYVDENYPSTIWQDGVPFVLHSSLSSRAREAILNAIYYWYKNTCITFTPRTNETEYLLFVGNDEGCWSTVGRDDSLAQQIVSIPDGCDYFGITTHEIGHALGLFHEQSRYDRDDYVVFNPTVVNRTILHNFAKVSPMYLSTYGLPYDIGSIMHYTPTEFSLFPNIPALIAVDPNLQQTMGQLGGPTFKDIDIMNKHYKCQDRCETLPPCQNGGFVNSRNCSICKCPSGFGGDYCDKIAKSFSKHCGGNLTAEENLRQFDMRLRQTSDVLKDKICVYHIVAPEGKKIVIDILTINTTCVEGCWLNALELKMRKDIRPVGYRFCCSEFIRRKIISDTNLVPMMIFSRIREITISLQYSFIDQNASLDDESIINNNNIIERTKHDADGVSSSISEFSFHRPSRVFRKRKVV